MIPGLVGRKVELELGVAGGPGKRISTLRIGFNVKHTEGSQPSQATVQVYNPSDATVALAQRKEATARLLAGYELTTAREIFAGDVVPKRGVLLTRQGADRILTLDLADGARGLQRLVSISIISPTTLGVVLEQVLAQTQWARGLITVPLGTALPQGVTHVGTAAELLDRLTVAVNQRWFVRDGALCIVPRGVPLPEAAPQFSAAAGTLVGSPQRTEKGWQITALLDAGMRPGRRFSVVSSAFTGTLVAGAVSFIGDSGWERPFYVRVEGVPE